MYTSCLMRNAYGVEKAPSKAPACTQYTRNDMHDNMTPQCNCNARPLLTNTSPEDIISIQHSLRCESVQCLHILGLIRPSIGGITFKPSVDTHSLRANYSKENTRGEHYLHTHEIRSGIVRSWELASERSPAPWNSTCKVQDTISCHQTHTEDLNN